MGKMFGFGLFFQRILKPMIMEDAGDEKLVQDNLQHHGPAAFAKLNGEGPAGLYSPKVFSIADNIAVSSWLRVGMPYPALEISLSRR